MFPLSVQYIQVQSITPRLPEGLWHPGRAEGGGNHFHQILSKGSRLKRLLSVNGRQLSFDSDSEMKCIERRYQSQSAGVYRKAFQWIRQHLASSVLIIKLASRCRGCIFSWFWNSLWKEICYVCHTAFVLLNVLKGIVHPKMEIMSLLTHPHVFQTCMTYFFFCEKNMCAMHTIKINVVQFCFGTNWLIIWTKTDEILLKNYNILCLTEESQPNRFGSGLL